MSKIDENRSSRQSRCSRRNARYGLLTPNISPTMRLEKVESSSSISHSRHRRPRSARLNRFQDKCDSYNSQPDSQCSSSFENHALDRDDQSTDSINTANSWTHDSAIEVATPRDQWDESTEPLVPLEFESESIFGMYGMESEPHYSDTSGVDVTLSAQSTNYFNEGKCQKTDTSLDNIPKEECLSNPIQNSSYYPPASSIPSVETSTPDVCSRNFHSVSPKPNLAELPNILIRSQSNDLGHRHVYCSSQSQSQSIYDSQSSDSCQGSAQLRDTVDRQEPKQYTTLDCQQHSPNSCTNSETCSWSSDNDTDFGDESDDARSNSSMADTVKGGDAYESQTASKLDTKHVLSKAKQDLVDHVMVEFWQIFNEGNEANVYDNRAPPSFSSRNQEASTTPHDGDNAPSSQPESKSHYSAKSNGAHKDCNRDGKRKRVEQDEDENDEAKDRNPKRPKDVLSPPQTHEVLSKFACPYRKHDARKYCVRSWRSCALTPSDTVARVKGHLYKFHRIYPCHRCKELFKDQQQVTEHLQQPQACKLLESVQRDGITNSIYEKLRTKKKAHRNQNEADRWREIYKIIFPGETVPSPFFEEIQEDMRSPDSHQLEDYEGYCRRELPRVFRASLEEIVNNTTQPLEEQLRSQLMELIRDAQDRVFSSYRSSSRASSRTPAGSTLSSSPRMMSSSSIPRGSPIPDRQITDTSAERSRVHPPAFLQPPSPQINLGSGLEIQGYSAKSPKPNDHEQSDSGYDSGSFAASSGLLLTSSDSNINTFLLSDHALHLSSTATSSHSENDVMQERAEDNVDPRPSITGNSNETGVELSLSQDSQAFDTDWLDLDLDYFKACDFSQNHEFTA